MTRRQAIFTTLTALGALLALTGCGGTNQVDTDGNGRLRDVDVSPVPGATFLPRTTEFTVFWSSGFEPPASFTARMYRLRSDASSDEEIPTSLVRDGSAFRWFLRPSGDLPTNSAVYLELSAPGESTLRFSYIVGTSRAQSLATPLPERPGAVTALRHTITVR
jgi:hypothetical protein